MSSKSDKDLIKQFKIEQEDNIITSNNTEKFNLLKLNLVPGTLHINVNGIIGKFDDNENIDSFFIVLSEKEDGMVGIREISKESFKSCNEYFKINVNDFITVKFLLFLKYKGNEYEYNSLHTIKTLEKRLKRVGSNYSSFELSDFKKWHNGLSYIDFQLKKRTEKNPFKRFLEFFEPSLPEIYGLKAQICYTSLDEEKIISKQTIQNISELQNWLDVRMNTYKEFFHGYVNLKGYNLQQCTHLWKRRYIEWNGYKISIFNVYTREEIGVIDLMKNLQTISVYSVDINEKNFLKDNLMKINFNNGFIELHFDNFKNFEKCLSAAEHLFGRVHKLKTW